MITYVIIAFIPMIVLGVFSYNRSKLYLEEQMIRDLNNHTIQLGSSIASRLEKDSEFLRVTTFNPLMTEDLTAVTSLYDIMVLSNTYFEPVIWYNLTLNRDFKNFVIYYEDLHTKVGPFLSPSTEVAHTPLYQETLQSHKTLWTKRDSYLLVTRRMYDVTQGRAKGAMYLTLDIKHIIDSIIAQELDEYGCIITDTRGEVIFSRGSYNRTLPEHQVEAVLQDTDHKVVIGSETFLAAPYDLQDQQWNMTVYIPANYGDGLAEIIKLTVIMTLMCGVILIGVILLLSKSMVSRIIHLNNRMKLVGQGNLAVMTYSDYTDEIGQLNNQFEDMLTKMNRLIAEVYQDKLILKDAELRVLQSQVNPHFLYNTLALINWKALEAENQDISTITNMLASFYRTSLNKGSSVIAVSEELKNIKSYINLQLIMHDNSFSVEYQIDQGVYDHRMIHFVLQPIVENAIIHGLDECDIDREKILTVKGRLTHTHIEFAIVDNGHGMSQEQVEALLEKETAGYGVKNVHERLTLFYNDTCGLHIESSEKVGTTVQVRVLIS